jgi:hypothetical protein
MGNKSSTSTSTSNSSNSKVTNKTEDMITISGFGGYGDTTDRFALNIKSEIASSGMTPFTITGTYTVKIRPEFSLDKTDKTVVEVGTLKTTEDQTIKIGTKTYTFKAGTYNISKTQDGKHTLINDSENPLKNLIVPAVSMGGRRKRQTKGRKAKKHSRRRRSIRA